MNTNDLHKIRRRIMFVKSEDVYFIAYNCLLILTQLKGNAPGRPFRDYRKLSFLIDFVSDSRLTAILVDAKTFGLPASAEDRHELSAAYSRGASRMPHVMRVICALETKGLLHIERGSESEGFDLYVRPEQIPAGFLLDELYEAERANLQALVGVSSRLRTVRLATMLQQFFKDNGVEAWHA